MRKLVITQVRDGGFIIDDLKEGNLEVAADIWALQRKVEAFFKEEEVPSEAQAAESPSDPYPSSPS